MGANILIIDDEPDVVAYLTAVLQANGYVPYSATDPDLGLEMIRRNRPDLICLDIMMPEKSGISIYIKIKEDIALRDIPVLIISGVARESDFDFRSYVPNQSIPAPDHYLEKPIVLNQYLNIIKDLTTFRKRRRKGKVADA
jgi:CheY-like chemotaxis protein